jgi:hypothetical protein
MISILIPVGCFVVAIGIGVYALCKASADADELTARAMEQHNELTSPLFTYDEGGNVRDKEW